MARSGPNVRLAVLCASLAVAACDLDTAAPIPDEPMTLVGADRQSRVFVVDESSGATTLLDTVMIHHPLNPSVIVPIGAVTSMTWVPTLDMWWLATGRNGAICASCIVAYDPAMETVRPFRRNISDVDTIADFAVHPTNGRLYTFPVDRGGYLFRVDTENAIYREVMRTLDEGSSGKGTTFWTDGHLYVSGGLYGQRLTRIDVSGMRTDEVGPLTYVGFPPFEQYSVTVQSMATRRADGVVFALVHDGGGWAGNITSTYLATLDPTNAVVLHVGETSPPLNALAYVPTRFLP